MFPDQFSRVIKTMGAAADLSLIYATDSIEEAIEHVRNKAIEPFGLKSHTRGKRRSFPWLGECGLSRNGTVC